LKTYLFPEVRDKIVCIIFNKDVSVPEEHISVFITKHYIKQQNIFCCCSEAAFRESLAISLSTAKKSKPLADSEYVKSCKMKAVEIILLIWTDTILQFPIITL
jgi:hypothetical protein